MYKIDNIKCWQVCKDIGTFINCWWNAEWYRLFKGKIGSIFQN